MSLHIEPVERRGWDVVRLLSDELIVDVLPGKGGDILSVIARGPDVELLWRTPWGLRHKGAMSPSGDSEALLMDGYPGGWQTVFPNAGAASSEHGTIWGMHGEAWLAPYDWSQTGPGEITLSTRLVRSPFRLERRIGVSGNVLTVAETAFNEGGVPIETAWGHHVAFGAPFLSGDCSLEVPSGTRFVVDDSRVSGDLVPGSSDVWPYAESVSGTRISLASVPAARSGVDRLGYLVGLPSGSVSLRNPRLSVEARLGWDLAVMPYAWLWFEMNATPEFPWYRAAYVLGIEPHSSHPGQGLEAIRSKTGTQLSFAPGQSRTATTTLEVVA